MTDTGVLTVADAALAKNRFCEALPRLSADAASAHNKLLERSRSIEVKVGDRSCRLRIRALKATQPRPVTFTMDCGNDPLAQVSLPNQLINGLCRAVAPELHTTILPAELTALLLELVLSDLIVLLEDEAGSPVTLAAPTLDIDLPTLPCNVILSVAIGGEQYDVSLAMTLDAARWLGRVLNENANAETYPSHLAVLSLPGAVTIGEQWLTVHELRFLSPGDTIVMDGPRRPVLRISSHIAASVEIDRNRLVLTSHPKTCRHDPYPMLSPDLVKRNFPMSTEPADILNLEDLPIRVEFQLARLDIPLRDVKALAVGSVVPVSPSLGEMVSIIANGTAIGRGSMVQLGEGLGVLIERLHGHD